MTGRKRRTPPQVRAPLAITMGDPAGVGPEIISLAMEDGRLQKSCVVIGNADRLKAAARKAGSSTRYRPVSTPAEALELTEEVGVLEVPLAAENLPFGKLSAQGGDCAYQCLIRAIDLALAGEVCGITTAPLNKESLNLAGHRYPGHTEILAEKTGAVDTAMMLASRSLRVVHVTTHIPLAMVPEAITQERILRVLELGSEAMQRMGFDNPRFAVAGLNPHSGEGGIFGTEEQRVIIPAVEEARKRGHVVSGPVPPDVVFIKMHRGHYDAVVAMYHDQGHIPFKLLAFESGVNVSLGLPIIRTSVDHGTAFDIAGKGLADPGSLIEAIHLGLTMTGKV